MVKVLKMSTGFVWLESSVVECTHGKRKTLGSSPDRATFFFRPCDIWWPMCGDQFITGRSTGARRLDSFFFFFFYLFIIIIFFFFAFSPVWRPLRYVHAIILPLKPFLSILNQPSSMGYYIDKVRNAVS